MKEVDLIAYFHGTEIPSKLLKMENVTPSQYFGDKKTHRDVRNMGLTWAAAGFAVFLPDYIGFGITSQEDHPYVYYPEMFQSNYDGLLAVKSFLKENGYGYDNRLFLTGWSQGAGASLSAHRYIQENHADAFQIIASSGLAGPYNFHRFAMSALANQEEKVDILPILSWGLFALNKYSTLKRPTDQIYAYPVFDQMSALIVPSMIPKDVFNPLFLMISRVSVR